MTPEFQEKAKKELNLDDEGLLLRFGDDFRRVYAPYRLPKIPLSEGAVYRTVFGIERSGIGYGQPLSHPLADATLKEIHDYPWPDSGTVTQVSGVRSAADIFGKQYAILGGDWSPYWHDAIDLLGMENLYLKMFDEPELVDALLKHITDFYFESSRLIFDTASDVIDIFFIGNDFGSQTGPLLSPEMFNRFLLPPLKRLINLGHDYGLLVQLHSCGGFEPLIPAMIEAGLDGLHAIQPSCHGMNLHTLKADYGDRILLNGAIDSHHVLIDCPNPDCVRKKTFEILDILTPGGGYVAGASHDTILEETPVENVLAMFDAVLEYSDNQLKDSAAQAR
jgi:uroporphyrinogen-III decarboxylase